jgi:hypothetical protein
MGATFMDWSWHWLKGSESYWNYQKGRVPLVQDPILDMNAHGHSKNHPTGLEEWRKFIRMAKKESLIAGEDVSLYPNHDRRDGKEFVNNVNWFVKQGVDVVVIERTEDLHYAELSARGEKGDGHGNKPGHDFFIGSAPLTSDDTSVRKMREIISITYSSQQRTWLKKLKEEFKHLDKNVMKVTDRDWIYKTEDTMPRIMDRFNQPIMRDRVAHWHDVVKKWRGSHQNIEYFYNTTMPEIAKKIVDGESMDLRPFEFGFLDECFVMMLVMVNHSCRLVLTDDNFPKNTKDLHKFLK